MSTSQVEDTTITAAAEEAQSLFERHLGVTEVDCRQEVIGNQVFLTFTVGRRAPIYEDALLNVQKTISSGNPFKGLLKLSYAPQKRFPQSLEANVLQLALTRSTRQIIGQQKNRGLSYVPFQNREDCKVVQPATHLIVGRRGVGKSTLIMRAMELLADTPNLAVALDMQRYSEATGETLFREVLADLAEAILASARRLVDFDTSPLQQFADDVLHKKVGIDRAAPVLHRLITKLTRCLGVGGELYIFLDDFHLVEPERQPELLHILHACVKGAGGWLKVAGLRSLLNAYDPTTRKGLQVPGDAQLISLDLTLVDPETAENHLRTILGKFLETVGIASAKTVILEPAFRRLVWANAGVPRDFLQMLGRSLEHARRSNRPKITVTDTNLAIGEFGQQKMDDLEQDARNEQNTLRKAATYLERFCLDDHKVNAFLVRSEQSKERSLLQTLSDLRIVHLIHPTITPHKAGQRYEAFLLDYSLFTGFRRRPNIKEMRPSDGHQFKASELRTIPALPRDFVQNL